ncbi:MAG: glutamyl-tRNA reductase [Gemmatimonadales bacterium]|nr:glutamyl-tRNA reductase [Gemmatimonadales bacterium]
MSLYVRSVNHHHAPTDIRERAHLDPELAVALMKCLENDPSCVAALPVSTCNRTEIYLEMRTDADPDLVLRQALIQIGADADLFAGRYSIAHDGIAAVRHLFRVASALESMMLGEPQISQQLKDAYRLARKHSDLGPILLRAFQGAFRSGKRVRTETRITTGAVSVAFGAVELARKFFSSLGEQDALLVGAGETGALAARHFLQHDIGHLTVVNRSLEKAKSLAADLDPANNPNNPGGQVSVRPWEELADALADTDVVLSTTGALEPVILPEMVAAAVEKRRGEPMFLLDIAVPRDIHPDVGKIDGVYLFGLDDLDEIIKGNKMARRKQVPHAEKIIEEELTEFQTWMDEVDLRPTVAEFKSYLEELKDKQVGYVRKKQSDEVAAAVDSSLQQFIKKVLGRSVSTLKKAESPEERDRDLDALRRMFSDDLGEPRDLEDPGALKD